MAGQNGDKMALTVWLEKGLAERTRRPAEKGGLAKSKHLSNLIEVGIEKGEYADTVGLWHCRREQNNVCRQPADGDLKESAK